MNCIMYGVRYVRYWYVAVTKTAPHNDSTRRGQSRVIDMYYTIPSLPRAIPFFCPICPTRYPTRKLILEHPRSEPEPAHKALIFGACESPHYPQLLDQGVMSCPLGCGAYFNGGEHGVSKPLELHVIRANCRDKRPQAIPAELDGPYLATSIAGVRTSLTAQARTASSDPHQVPPPTQRQSSFVAATLALHRDT